MDRAEMMPHSFIIILYTRSYYRAVPPRVRRRPRAAALRVACVYAAWPRHGGVVGGCIRGPRTKTSYASWFLGKPAVQSS
jgi:hypothetical protein